MPSLGDDSAGFGTTLMAIAALVISAVNAGIAAIPNTVPFFDPKVEMAVPDRLRLVQYQDENGTRIEAYVQPTFVNVGWNQQVEVIRGMTLQARPVKGDSPMEFRWSNRGKFRATAPNDTLTGCPAEEYVGNTKRVVLAPNDPVAPVMLFEPAEKAEDLYFEPGKEYQMTLDVQPTLNEKSRSLEFTVDITEDVISLMNSCKSAVLIPVSS